jgi:sec-independent protein translocase protein TatC
MARVLKRPNLPALRIPQFPRAPKTDEPYEDVFEEMTLQEHLEELRSRIIKACIAVAVAFIGGLALAGPLLGVIVDKANADQNGGLDIKSPTDPITLYMKIALYIAIGFAMPLIIWQLIGFLAPGLTRREKRVLFSSLPFVTLLFVVGVSYAFFFAVPAAFRFLSGWQTDVFSWEPDGGEVIGFYLTVMIGLGIAFQMPVVMFLLAKLNIVGPKRMSQYRKYAALAILVASAIITPSTDPFNMAIVALPLLALYEIGIIIARIFARPMGTRNI